MRRSSTVPSCGSVVCVHAANLCAWNNRVSFFASSRRHVRALCDTADAVRDDRVHSLGAIAAVAAAAGAASDDYPATRHAPLPQCTEEEAHA